MFPNLKLQIFRARTHQNQLAEALGMHETTLSKIIHGYREPSESQRRILASYLGVSESWLFEKYEDVGKTTTDADKPRAERNDKSDM